MSNKVLGKNEILFIYTAIKNGTGATVAANYFPVGCLTSNGLNFTTGMNDSQKTKCNLNPDPMVDNVTYELPFEAVAYENNGTNAMYKDLRALMYAAAETGAFIYWKIETTMSDGTKETEFGKGYLTSLSKSAPVEGEVTFSGSIRGSGKVSATDLKV